eukprot:CAMPEP_0179224062 /NCGR_PEP_ID=MMETSP0797-20121207/7584_1 /TAXON_ID=47934 /ORGANISM="Dinophysis acuminata, Strain DAEP01" /LENGTH=124 /DNA_ID=CAMNT_0020931007 /DNA_START=44 /DNA_END=418 /DNA_ORIENTATION=-
MPASRLATGLLLIVCVAYAERDDADVAELAHGRNATVSAHRGPEKCASNQHQCSDHTWNFGTNTVTRNVACCVPHVGLAENENACCTGPCSASMVDAKASCDPLSKKLYCKGVDHQAPQEGGCR